MNAATEGVAPALARASVIEVATVMVVTCVSLAVLDYYGKPYLYPASDRPSSEQWVVIHERARELQAAYPEAVQRDRHSVSHQRHRYEIGSYVWWAGACLLVYVLIPLASALVLARGKLARLSWLGLSPIGFFRHAWIYAVLLALVAPVVYVASTTREFRDTYPFCLLAHLSLRDWLIFEACYLFQFLALEFFFRGYMLFTLERHIGRLAVYVMVVPYCMIHFGKPFAETMGAIVAGIVLGELALRYRSIWGGVAVHCAVAVGMDLLSMHHAGSLAVLLQWK